MSIGHLVLAPGLRGNRETGAGSYQPTFDDPQCSDGIARSPTMLGEDAGLAVFADVSLGPPSRQVDFAWDAVTPGSESVTGYRIKWGADAALTTVLGTVDVGNVLTVTANVPCCMVLYWNVAALVGGVEQAYAPSGGIAYTGENVSLVPANLAHAQVADPCDATLGQATLALADLAHAHVEDAVTVTTQSVLAAADLAHAHVLDAPTLSTQSTFVLADLAHAQVTDALTVSTGTDVDPAALAHSQVLDAPTLSVDDFLAIAGLAHAHVTDNLTFNGGTALAPADLDHAHAFDGISITVNGLTTIDVAWDAVPGEQGYRVRWGTSPGVYTQQQDVAQGVTTLSVYGLAYGVYYFTVAALAGGVPQSYAPEVTVYAGLATAIAPAELGHVHALDGPLDVVPGSPYVPTLATADMAHAHTLSAPVVSITLDLAVAGLAHAHAASSCDVVALATVLLLWDDIVGGTEDGYRVKVGTSPGVYTWTTDVGADVLQATFYAVPSTTYYWTVMGLVAGVEQTPAAEQSFTPTLTALNVAAIDHAHTLGACDVVVASVLAVAGMGHAHALDAVAIGMDATLATASLAQAHTADAVALGLDTTLTTESLAQAHTADAVTLTTGVADLLVVADAAQAHVLDGLTLTATASLALADLAHAHALDAADVTVDSVLAVAGLAHAHTLDAQTLTPGGQIGSADLAVTLADLSVAIAGETTPLAVPVGGGGVSRRRKPLPEPLEAELGVALDGVVVAINARAGSRAGVAARLDDIGMAWAAERGAVADGDVRLDGLVSRVSAVRNPAHDQILWLLAA